MENRQNQELLSKTENHLLPNSETNDDFAESQNHLIWINSKFNQCNALMSSIITAISVDRKENENLKVAIDPSQKKMMTQIKPEMTLKMTANLTSEMTSQKAAIEAWQRQMTSQHHSLNCD